MISLLSEEYLFPAGSVARVSVSGLIKGIMLPARTRMRNVFQGRRHRYLLAAFDRLPGPVVYPGALRQVKRTGRGAFGKNGRDQKLLPQHVFAFGIVGLRIIGEFQ